MKRKNLVPYLLIAPAVTLMLLVVAIPIGKSVVMSFQQNVLYAPNDVHFIGMQNYLKIMHDPTFLRALINTVIWVFFGVGLQLLLGLVLATLLNHKFKGRGLIRSIILIPWVTPGILIGLMWTWMYDGNYGVINDILLRLHIINDYIPWLAKSSTSLGAVILTIVWQGIPFFAIMILASLQTIPQELYEATQVDGASKVQSFFYVTLPLIMPTLLITMLLRVIWVANSTDILYIMTGGGPGYSSMTLSVYTFTKARASMDFGYSSALSLCLTILLSFVAVIYLWKLKKQEVRTR
jgi:multiple sugar transport system permease protein